MSSSFVGRARACLVPALLFALSSCAGGGPGESEHVGVASDPVVTPAPVTPDNPYRPRPVHLIEDDPTTGNPAFVRPTIAPTRTSRDGRIGIAIQPGPDTPPSTDSWLYFHLNGPERLSHHVEDEAHPGTSEITAPGSRRVRMSELTGGGLDQFYHSILCDPGGNPHPCAGGPADSECYTLQVLSTHEVPRTTPAIDNSFSTEIELWGRWVEAEVANPKRHDTSQVPPLAASLVSVTPLGSAKKADGLNFPIKAIFEPSVTADGLLFVARATNTLLHLDGFTQPTNIFYVKNDKSPCDVDGFRYADDVLHPRIHRASWAPNDPDVHGTYGFADQQFRDTEGYPIDHGKEMYGTYPWIDSKGNNLFYFAVSSTLNFIEPPAPAPFPAPVSTRYPSYPIPGVASPPCIPGPSCAREVNGEGDFGMTGDPVEYDDEARGLMAVGRWTNGKMVLFDGLINNIDYGLRTHKKFHRKVGLYSGVGPALPLGGGYVRLGSGRDDGPAAFVNTSKLSSFEHLFNHHRDMIPRTTRDVVWIMNAGKATDEIAFDDYIDPDVFLFSDMTASLTWTLSPVAPDRLTYNDGFERVQDTHEYGNGFTQVPHLQNAATTTKYSNVPRSGVVTHGRIEPAALGGVQGKGFWLDPEGYVTYTLDGAPSPTPAAAYVSLFIDPRPLTPGGGGRLLRFPSGDEIWVVGSNVAFKQGGVVSWSVAIPNLLPASRYVHLGITFEAARTTLSLNGFPFATTTTAYTQIFRQGDLVLGGGFRGWVDDLKVIFRKPSFEEGCNHARGTIAALVPGPMPWCGGLEAYPAQASVHPAWAHENVSSQLGLPQATRYVCYHDYSKDLQQPMPPYFDCGALVSQRKALLDLPTFHFGSERPSSAGNAFCTGCHQSTQVSPTLRPDVLLPLVPSVNLEDDLRRQPMQPPRLVNGQVPEGYVQLTNSPGLPQADTSGMWQYLDRWVYP
jgi:hypothetical protein